MNTVPWISRVVGNPASAMDQSFARSPRSVDSSSWLHRPIPGIQPRGQSDATRHSATFHGVPSESAQAA